MDERPDIHPEWTPEHGPLEGDHVAVSASSLSGVLAKPQLEGWRAREGAVRIDEEWAMLTELRQTSPEGARAWMEDAAYHQHRNKLSATVRGEVIHAHFESWFGGPPPPEAPEYLHPMIANLARWVEETGFEPQLQEEVVWRDGGSTPLAGRLDTTGVVHRGAKPEYLGKLGCLDIKTSELDATADGRKRRPFPAEVSLQLAVYFYSELILNHRPRVMEKGRTRLYLLSEAERELATPAPDFDYAAVLYVTPERCEMYPVNLTRDHLGAAYAAAAVYWHQASVKGYLGRSIMEVKA